jgi:hypothetical protein
MIMATTSNKTEQLTVTPAPQKKCAQLRELLPTGAVRNEGMPDFQKAATAADNGFVTVGTVGKITVCYNSDLGAPGLTLAQQFLTRALSPYNDMEVIFGISIVGGEGLCTLCTVSRPNSCTAEGARASALPNYNDRLFSANCGGAQTPGRT